MNTQNLPSDILDDVVNFVEIASRTAKCAMDEVGVHRQQQKRASDLRDALLDHMIKNNVVLPQQKEAAATMLGGHAETMQLLKVAVDKIVALKEQLTKTGGDLGRATDPSTIGLSGGSGRGESVPLTKEGEYSSTNDPFVGRKTDFVKESDRPLLALIGR